MSGGPNHRTPFLRWPSLEAAARATGASAYLLRRYARGELEPPPAVRERLLEAGWNPAAPADGAALQPARRAFLRWPSVSAAARALGIPPSSLRRYARGELEPPPAVAARLLEAGWEPDPATRPRGSAAPPWLRSDGRTPAHERLWRLPSAEGIMRAKSRPRGCSEARWRMELRRRARGGMEGAPDPRDL